MNADGGRFVPARITDGGRRRVEPQSVTIESTDPKAAPSGGPGPIGWWTPGETEPDTGAPALADALRDLRRAIYVVQTDGGPAIGRGGVATLGAPAQANDVAAVDLPSELPVTGSSGGRAYPLLAHAPALDPATLGSEAFREAHGLRYAYVAGAMANGIASEAVVEAMSRAGMLGFFGAAGLSPERVERAIDRIQGNLGDGPWGFNLIHSPNDPALESTVVGLYLRRGVRLVSASAYLDLTVPLVRYRLSDIHRDADGRVICPNRVIAKVSRVEVARKFFSPAPAKLLSALVQAGDLTAEQARLAESVPVADDLTAEADSGGHTDNRPAMALIPTLLALRDELQAKHRYARQLCVGAAGGIATPDSAAAAFAMGADYVLTGTVNQACVEAGTSPTVRDMLARATQADVDMAPAADMFEMGVKVQVLKWGTMFAVRAKKLYSLYRECAGLHDISAGQRAVLERDYFRCTLDEAWIQTRDFFSTRDPSQIDRAEADPKHRMALVFRSYLGRSSDWANRGEPSRKADYQIWCGPAMGAFNAWTRGTFLESPERRDVVTVARNLLVGAAVLTRAHWLRSQGIALPADARRFAPLTPAELNAVLNPGGGDRA